MYDIEIVKNLSPTSLRITELKNQVMVDIFEKMNAHPTLSSSNWDDFNPKSSEFHMTHDNKLFHTSKIGSPLYKGENMHHFTHITDQKPAIWIDKSEGTDFLRNKEIGRINSVQRHSGQSSNQNITPKIDPPAFFTPLATAPISPTSPAP